MTPLQTVAALANRIVRPLLESTPLGNLAADSLTIVSYTGPRSGREVRFPVGYQRRGDEIVIGVMAPGQKTWWRLFRGEGRPLTVRLGGVDRPGHGVAHENAAGEVTVTVRLDAPAP